MRLDLRSMIAVLIMVLLLNVPLLAGGAHESSETGKDSTKLNGVVTMLGSAFEASLALALDDTSKANLKAIGITASHILLVGNPYTDLVKLQGSIVTVEGSVVSLAEWQSLGRQPVPKLASPKIRYVVDVETYKILP